MAVWAMARERAATGGVRRIGGMLASVIEFRAAWFHCRTRSSPTAALAVGPPSNPAADPPDNASPTTSTSTMRARTRGRGPRRLVPSDTWYHPLTASDPTGRWLATTATRGRSQGPRGRDQGWGGACAGPGRGGWFRTF